MSEQVKVGRIQEINGPIVTVELAGLRNGEQVRIGEIGLVGEVIALDGPRALVQAYESTEGVRPGEPVRGLGHPASDLGLHQPNSAGSTTPWPTTRKPSA